ncbi:restriction endonuclease subunit S [Lysinibacillus sp. NPDC058147]|uniref:restriction endonuclease subunit S n=1 Tax=unclassified Lysinibacillus TaxID=2636778 RepID=UPI0036DF81D3
MTKVNTKKYIISEIIEDIQSGVSVNSTNLKCKNNENGVLKTGCVKNGVFIPSENKKILEEDFHRAKLNPINNSIILNRSNTQELVGMVGYVDKDYPNLFLSDKLWLIKVNENIVDTEYFAYLLSTPKYSKKISDHATGTSASMKNISRTDFESLEVQLPPLNVQKNLKNFISILSRRIQIQQQNIETLNMQKKGYMQKVFSKELRFKDTNGKEFEKWEKYTLKEVLTEFVQKTKENNEFPVISSTNKGLMLQSEYFNRQVASENNTGYKILKKYQVVLSPQNLWLGNINYNSKYDIGIVSPSYKIFDINEQFDKSYIAYALVTPEMFYNYKISSEQGASIVRRNLNLDMFYEICFEIPCFEEQKTISSFLEKFDKKINFAEEKLFNLQVQKQAFMQQIFI